MAPPNDLIGYDALQQEALRGVVRAALKIAAAKHLPGDHHFFITFRTAAPGVTLPKELLARYPDEMSIVLQHEYWDLAPGETFFSVTLKFGGQPKSLAIPYAAITHFRDPGVEYQLRFTVPDAPATPLPAPAPAADAAGEKTPDGPNIVSLDHFRKK
ncbi:MAG TPA: ClpXP protease specificity-enhancing factor SspB [Caulobacteraceae bacterium]|nr:ClpXP protease specificity-enhancing factor SspB [Caulobacteraceae bacterium]